MKFLCKILYRLIPVVIALLPFVVSARTYYVSAYGSDIGSGAEGNPFGSLNYATARLQDGDKLYIVGDMNGSMYMAGKRDITISGFNGVSSVSSGIKYGLVADNCPGITITDLALWGTKADAYQDGIGIWFKDETYGGNVNISNVYVSGYGGRGIAVYNYQDKEISNINIINSTVRNCKWDGIYVGGADYWNILHNINGVTVKNCIAQENTGGAVNWLHTGSGIFISCAKNVLIRDCESAYNGAGNLSTSGGPVGIWVGDVENGLIINCKSYNNTSNLLDGGGFDIDGGCLNVIIDSCESYENKGAGYMVYEWATTSGFRINNVLIKNSSSTNDGINSARYGALFIGSTSDSKISNVTFTNLVIKQDQGYVLRASGSFDKVSITGNNICYNVPAQFSNFNTQPAGVTIESNTFPCVVLSIDTTKPYTRPVGFPSSYYLITYPNPASGSINAVMNAPRGHYRIEVYSAFGQLMEKTPIAITGKKTINLSLKKYAAGVYIIMLVDEYGIEAKTKFLKL